MPDRSTVRSGADRQAGVARIGNSLFRIIMTMALVILGGVGVSRAEDDQEVERTARKACLSGNYVKGVELLSDLFVRTKEPTHIYNQARCYEQNGRFEEAILRFREFLVIKSKTLDAEERADAEQHLATCQALLESNQAKRAEAPRPSPIEPPTAVSPPTPSNPLVATSPDRREPARREDGGLRMVGLICGGAGVAAVGTGIYFYSKAASYSDKVSNQDPWNPADEAAGKRAETMQWVFYSAGGALLATGVVLYVLGSRAGESHAEVAGLTPWFGHESLGLSAQGRF
jgi:tetratricopeptide (TPR) repeat protein